MGQVVRMPITQQGKKAPALKGQPGGNRRPENIRERLQPGPSANRGSRKVTLPDALPLLPRDPPAGLTEWGEEAYRRIEKEQREWDAAPGFQAFVTLADLEGVLNYCRLYDRMQTLLAEGRAIEKAGPLDRGHVQTEIKAIESADKALRTLGYVPGSYPHLKVEDEAESESDLFGD